MWYPEAVEWSTLQIFPSLGGGPRMQDFAKTGKAPGTLETLVSLPEGVSSWDLINNSSQDKMLEELKDVCLVSSRPPCIVSVHSA